MRGEQLLADPVLEYGDRAVAQKGQILRTTVGSGVHGIAIEGTDDHDEMAIFVEPAEWALGVRPHRESYIARSQPEGARSGPGDTDLVAYTLRSYLRLAIKGNPTALLPLFAPAGDLLFADQLGHELRSMGPMFLSQEAAHRFLGFMRSQRDALVSRGTRCKPNRPELVARYGYDVKYASHALRLQGREVTLRGRLTLPMPEPERRWVLAVKSGAVPRLDDVLDQIDAVATEVQDALDQGTTALPRYADVEAIERWSLKAHRRQWGWA